MAAVKTHRVGDFVWHTDTGYTIVADMQKHTFDAYIENESAPIHGTIVFRDARFFRVVIHGVQLFIPMYP